MAPPARRRSRHPAAKPDCTTVRPEHAGYHVASRWPAPAVDRLESTFPLVHLEHRHSIVGTGAARLTTRHRRVGGDLDPLAHRPASRPSRASKCAPACLTENDGHICLIAGPAVMLRPWPAPITMRVSEVREVRHYAEAARAGPLPADIRLIAIEQTLGRIEAAEHRRCD